MNALWWRLFQILTLSSLAGHKICAQIQNDFLKPMLEELVDDRSGHPSHHVRDRKHARSTDHAEQFSKLERIAVDKIFQNHNIFALQRSKKPLLCVIFSNVGRMLDSRSETGQRMASILQANMAKMNASCDFAVLNYNCSAHQASPARQLIQDTASTTNAKLAMFKCLKPHFGKHATNSTFFQFLAKPMMYDRVLPLLPNYHRVWLLDEDISLLNLNPAAFLNTLDCAFWPNPPPLVAQTTILESSQRYAFANQHTWRGSGVVATSSDFIEVQMPILNATFFDWFVRYVITPMGRAVSESSFFVDAGVDSMFCNSASIYATHALFGLSSLDTSRSYVSCAVFTAESMAVSHANMQSLPRDSTFYDVQASKVMKLFPHFYDWPFNFSWPEDIVSLHPEKWINFTSVRTCGLTR